MNIKNIIFLYFVFVPIVLFSQNTSSTYSLEEIINIALNTSPKFETTKLELKKAELSYTEQISFIYPQIGLRLNVPLSFYKSEQENYISNLDRYQTTSRTHNRISPRLSINSQQNLFNDGKLSLNISGNNSRWNSDNQNTGNRFSGSANVGYTQKLFSVNNYAMDKQKADWQLKLARINYSSQKNDFKIRIIEKYYELLIKKKSNEINILLLKNTRFQRNLTVELFNAGRKTELDTLNSNIYLKNAELNTLRNREDLHKIKIEFIQMAGMTSNELFDINSKIEFIPFAFSQAEIVEMCLINHPQIQRDQIEIEKTRMALNKQKSAAGMSLDFSTSFLYQNNKDYQSHTTADQNYNWDVGLNFSMPLFDGGKSSARIQQSEINTKKQNISLTENSKKYKNEIVDLYQQFSIKREEIKILLDKHRAASRALELANEKFKNGNYSLTELSQNENEFYRAELDQLQTIIDYNKIVYQLKNYAGMELLP
jgi:outer membrane protein